MSPASASIMAAAIGFAFSITASAARLSALPPTTAERAPYVPRPNGTCAVSPCT